MKVVASFKTEQQVLDELRSRHVNVSELVHSLLMDWLSGEKPSIEKLKEEVEQAEKDALIAKSRHHYLKQQLEKQLTLLESEAAELRKKNGQCCLCNAELSNRKQKLYSGEHTGRYVCGTISSGCLVTVMDSEKKREWLKPQKVTA